MGNETECVSFDLRPSDAINIAVRCKVLCVLLFMNLFICGFLSHGTHHYLKRDNCIKWFLKHYKGNINRNLNVDRLRFAMTGKMDDKPDQFN